jgi:hypothetical protein
MQTNLKNMSIDQKPAKKTQMSPAREKGFLQMAFVAVILLICIVIVAMVLHHWDQTKQFVCGKWNEIRPNLLASIISGIVITIFWGALYRFCIGKKARRSLVDTCHKVWLLDGSIAGYFSPETKRSLVKNSISAIIGHMRGGDLYANVVEQFLNRHFSYREKFTYHIALSEGAGSSRFPQVTGMRPPGSNCYLMNEMVAYEKHFDKNCKIKDCKIVLVFDEKNLMKWLDDNSVFFREVVNLDTNVKTEIIKTEVSIRKFVFGIDDMAMQVSFFEKNTAGYAKINDSDCEIKTADDSILITIPGRVLKKYIITPDKDSERFNHYGCKLNFFIPYIKKSFVFILPEPTRDPHFSIVFPESIIDTDYVSFDPSFGCKAANQLRPTFANNRYDLATNGMIYPRSGIVFFWQTK